MRETAPNTAGVAAQNNLRVVGQVPECAVGVMENYVLLVWRRKLVTSGAHWARRAFLDLRRERPADKLGFYTVVDAQCDLSTPSDVREEVAALLQLYAKHLAGAAITFEGQGFKMTMVRSVITAINITSRTQFPNSVFAKLELSAQWLYGHARLPNATVGPGDLVTAIGQLRIPNGS